jgi:hypothetical protein
VTGGKNAQVAVLLNEILQPVEVSRVVL